MRKQDLKTGMRVRLRGGGIYIVIKDIDSKYYDHQEISFVSKNSFINGSGYNDELLFREDLSYDIVEVYSITHDQDAFLCGSLFDTDIKYSIWKREKVITYSESLIRRLVEIEMREDGYDSNSIDRMENLSSVKIYIKE